jgi:hypothetical protein
MTEWGAFLAVGLIMVGIILFSPTSDIVNKMVLVFQNRFGVQPVLDENSVASVTVNGVELTGEQRTRFIQNFNQVNFLFHGGFEPNRGVAPVQVEIHFGKRTLLYSLYVYGEQVEIIRHKNNEALAYRVLSADLRDWLLSIQQSAV